MRSVTALEELERGREAAAAHELGEWDLARPAAEGRWAVQRLAQARIDSSAALKVTLGRMTASSLLVSGR